MITLVINFKFHANTGLVVDSGAGLFSDSGAGLFSAIGKHIQHLQDIFICSGDFDVIHTIASDRIC